MPPLFAGPSLTGDLGKIRHRGTLRSFPSARTVVGLHVTDANDRALFPLLVMIERHGPIGVVELAGLVGRDHTTVSRQLACLVRRRLITRRPSPTDARSSKSKITPKGKTVSDALTKARERLAGNLFANWSHKDIRDLMRLMRRLTDSLMSMPMSNERKAWKPGGK